MLSRLKILLLGCLATVAIASTSLAAAPVTQDATLDYLEQLTNWQRSAAALEPATDSAREIIFRDSLRQNALHVLQSGFAFARNEAGQQSAEARTTPPEGQEQTPRQRMTQRADETEVRVNQLNQRIAELGRRIPASAGKARIALQTQRAEAQDELKITIAKQLLLKTVLANMSAAEAGESKSYLGKVNNLARSIPELSGSPAHDTSTPTAPTPSNGRAVTSILSLAGDIFDITRKQRELSDVIAQTENLETTSKTIIAALRKALDQSTEPTTAAENKTPQTQTIDERVAAYKQIGADLVPLGDATLWVGISKRALEDWDDVLNLQLKTLTRQLAVHLAILLITLAIPLALSEMIRRGVGRYVSDPKRQRQAQTARRVFTGIAVFIILLMNFISDFGSFATFAGFLTAGIAVALQSPLLSLVGHFFFYGRYGVRKGDRITVAGVTGDILQIGMMRFYIRELQMSEGEMKPTGKVVAFPNSILFQPTAFYKYVSVA